MERSVAAFSLRHTSWIEEGMFIQPFFCMYISATVLFKTRHVVISHQTCLVSAAEAVNVFASLSSVSVWRHPPAYQGSKSASQRG